jgi:hypothetical protein
MQEFFSKKSYSKATLVLKLLSASKNNGYEKDIVCCIWLLAFLLISKLPEG